MRKKRLLYLIIPAIALILEILPYGAVLNFAYPDEAGTIVHKRVLYSYFDLTPFGYANFAPLITAALTCAILVLTLICCFTENRRALSAAKTLSYLAFALSLCPLLFGISCFSVVGMLITLSLLAAAVLLSSVLKKEAKP